MLQKFSSRIPTSHCTVENKGRSATKFFHSVEVAFHDSKINVACNVTSKNAHAIHVNLG